MLPGIVECVEIEKVWVPSRPRLQIFDGLLVGSGEETYLFMSRMFPHPEVGFSPANGELRSFWIREAIACSESVSKKVQAAPQAVDDKTSLCVYDRWTPADVREFVELLSALRLHLLDQFVWATVVPRPEALFKNFELGVGPINARLNIQEIITHVTYQP